MFTVHVSREDNAIGRDRFVCFHSLYLFNKLIFDRDFCMCMGHQNSLWRWKVKVTGQGQRSMQICVSYTSRPIYTAASHLVVLRVFVAKMVGRTSSESFLGNVERAKLPRCSSFEQINSTRTLSQAAVLTFSLISQ